MVIMLVSGTFPLSLSRSSNPFRYRMVFEMQPKEGAMESEEQQAPFSLPGPGLRHFPPGKGKGTGRLPSLRLGAHRECGWEGVACASPGGNHRKQTLSSLARSLQCKTRRPRGWRTEELEQSGQLG